MGREGRDAPPKLAVSPQNWGCVEYTLVGELKSMDSNGKEVWVTEDSDKAELLADFYSRIFTVKQVRDPLLDLILKQKGEKLQ